MKNSSITSDPKKVTTKNIFLRSKMKLCRLNKLIYEIWYIFKVFIYFVFPIFIFTLFSAALLYFTDKDVIFQWGSLALILTITFFISKWIYQFIDFPENYYEHPSGIWEYESEGSCVRVLRCKFCKQEVVLPERHILEGDWNYINEKSCKQYRKCKRCDYIEYRDVPHKFDNWKYVSDNICNQVRRCNRCEEIKKRGDIHIYSDWKYIDDKICNQERICIRCENKSTRVEHKIEKGEYLEIEKWKYDEVTHTKKGICSRCENEIVEPYSPGMTAEQEEEYKFTYW